MTPRSPGDGSPSRLDRVRHSLEEWKPRIAKWLLALVAALGVAAEIIEPLGNVLKGQGFLGGSFAALIALILFDAISEPKSQEVSGVYVLTDLPDLDPSVKEAFEARNISIDFSGFSMQTLLDRLGPSLRRLGDETVHTQKLTLRLIIAHLNLPLSLPGKLEQAQIAEPTPRTVYYFADSPENRERMREGYTKQNWNELKELLIQVHRRNPHIAINCEIRESPQVPERKLFILNQEKIFSVPYGIKRSRKVWQGTPLEILDTEGFGLRYGNARIIGWDRRSRSRSTQEIAEHHMEWHRNLWETLEDVKPRNPVISDPKWVRPTRSPARTSR